jgi:clan AA aspartic protease (TIGR02281 family)
MFIIDDLILWGIAPLLIAGAAKVAKGPPDDEPANYYQATAAPQSYAPASHGYAPAAHHGQQDDGVRIECNRNHQFFATTTLCMGGKSAKTNMLIDTGATDTHISHKTARAMGIQLNRLRYDGQVQTASGRERTAKFVVPEIHIQDTPGQLQATLYDVTVSIIQRDVAGNDLLGMSALRQISATIERDTLVLRA